MKLEQVIVTDDEDNEISASRNAVNEDSSFFGR
jgi:hypothetical protein